MTLFPLLPKFGRYYHPDWDDVENTGDFIEMKSRKYLIAISFTILCLAFLGNHFLGELMADNKDYYYLIRENQSLFGRIFEEISLRYVEEIDPENFLKSGINGMLEQLDPYTVFIEKEENDELQIMSQGKYGGLGMRIIIREKYPTIIDPPFAGTPAEKAGLIEGDQIVKINGTSTEGIKSSEAANQMRGEPGSKVSIMVKRPGEEETIHFNLIRAIIQVKDITYTGLIQDDIGYIQLTHFSKDAGTEVKQAIKKLQAQGAQKLILDLRGNPGGLLEAAVTTSNHFLPKGKLIVETKGRIPASNQSYQCKTEPVWGNLPLAVLVDGMSASASEITAGAIQDYDRGIIVGTPTFGKGLVQTVVQVGKDADLKITTAQYYLPSGRCIQREHVFDYEKGSVLMAAKDSTRLAETDSSAAKKEFKTAIGRIFYEGAGVHPDVEVHYPKYNRYQIALIRQSMFFGFAVQYHGAHPGMTLDFDITETMLSEFQQYLVDKKFDYEPETAAYFKKFKKAAARDSLAEKISAEFDALEKAILENKNTAFSRNGDFIHRSLVGELAAKIAGYKGKVEKTSQFDPALQKAIKILQQPDDYAKLLQPSR